MCDTRSLFAALRELVATDPPGPTTLVAIQKWEYACAEWVREYGATLIDPERADMASGAKEWAEFLDQSEAHLGMADKGAIAWTLRRLADAVSE